MGRRNLAHFLYKEEISMPTNQILAINDLSSLSRCSLGVAIPIITRLGVKCAGVPTAILSRHTGNERYFFDDYTDNMKCMLDDMYDDVFSLIYTGFLGSEAQIDIVYDYIENYKYQTLVLVDPVMGDNGDKYDTYTHDMCDKMKKLVSKADIVTPNVTEACLLTGEKYESDFISLENAENMAKAIAEIGAENVIITGIKKGDTISNFVYNAKTGSKNTFTTPLCEVYYSGTGDVFASVISACASNGLSIDDAVKKATDFTYKATIKSHEMGIHPVEGIAIESVIEYLK